MCVGGGGGGLGEERRSKSYYMYSSTMSAMFLLSAFLFLSFFCGRWIAGVLMSSVMFYRLTATQTSGSAGVFYCMASKPCELGLSDVDIRPASPGTENQFHCTNAVGYQEESVSPPCCLKKPSSRHRRGIDADSREFISDIPIRPQNGVEKESR